MGEANKNLAVDIGGVFLYSSDPQRLAQWYRRHLGIEAEFIEAENGYALNFYHRDPDDASRVFRIVWAVLPRKSERPADSQSYMINYRVGRLDETLAHLERLGVPVEKREDFDYGRFAWIHDPEGNRIELWEDLQPRQAPLAGS